MKVAADRIDSTAFERRCSDGAVKLKIWHRTHFWQIVDGYTRNSSSLLAFPMVNDGRELLRSLEPLATASPGALRAISTRVPISG